MRDTSSDRTTITAKRERATRMQSDKCVAGAADRARSLTRHGKELFRKWNKKEKLDFFLLQS